MLAIEQGYTDEYVLPPIIEEQIGKTKIFQVYFRPRGGLIDTTVSTIFDDDKAARPPASPLSATTLILITVDTDVTETRYKLIFVTIFNKKKLFIQFLIFTCYEY